LKAQVKAHHLSLALGFPLLSLKHQNAKRFATMAARSLMFWHFDACPGGELTEAHISVRPFVPWVVSPCHKPGFQTFVCN
jgi:hypothetical protein